MSKRPSLVLILVFEGFVDPLSHGFAMQDETFGDRRLRNNRTLVNYFSLETREQ